MPSLSFDKVQGAKPVAVVRGGDRDGSVLYLHTEEGRRAPGSVQREVETAKYMPDLEPHVKPGDRVKVMTTLVEAVEKGLDADALVGVPAGAKALFKKMVADRAADRTLELYDDAKFQPIPDPNPDVRQVWYVAGQSGSGKSYFARGIAEAYKKLFPEREVYLISKLQEDETLDRMKVGKPKRISLDSLVTDPPELDEFKDCLVIFDDFDTLSPPYDKVVHKLIEDLCIMGRHTRTSMLILSHYLTNYKKTRLILGEAHFLVVYPLATSYKALKYVCEHYGGMEAKQIAELKRLGRWVLIMKNFPSYVIAAQTAYMLHG